MRVLLIVASVILGLATFGAGQQPTPTQKELKVRMILDDGSTINASLLTTSVTIETHYGPLTLPSSEIRAVKFGNHLSRADDKILSDALRGVRSDVFAERDRHAKSIVKIGRRAIPALEALSLSPDLESKRRAQVLIASIVDNDSRKVITEDVISATKMEIRGVIRAEELEFTSGVLGKFKVGLPDLAQIVVYSEGSVSLILDAVKFGSNLESWHNTEVNVDNEQTLVVSANGDVDIWPQGPGQYIAAPKGYNTPGKGGRFLAGSLVGKIGENGSVFYIGENYRQRTLVHERGTLYLQITPSPWNNVSSGGYNVTVKTER